MNSIFHISLSICRVYMLWRWMPSSQICQKFQQTGSHTNCQKTGHSWNCHWQNAHGWTRWCLTNCDPHLFSELDKLSWCFKNFPSKVSSNLDMYVCVCSMCGYIFRLTQKFANNASRGSLSMPESPGVWREALSFSSYFTCYTKQFKSI